MHTGRIGTVQATFGFGHCLFFGVAGVYLFRAGGSAVNGVELVHRTAGDGGAFLRFHALAKSFAPRSFAVKQFFHGGLGLRGVFFLSRCLFSCMIFGHSVAYGGGQVGHFFTFHILERTHTFEHLVPFHLMTVKLGTIHANKLCFSAHGDAAGTAHACSIHHNGV